MTKDKIEIRIFLSNIFDKNSVRGKIMAKIGCKIMDLVHEYAKLWTQSKIKGKIVDRVHDFLAIRMLTTATFAR